MPKAAPQRTFSIRRRPPIKATIAGENDRMNEELEAVVRLSPPMNRIW